MENTYDLRLGVAYYFTESGDQIRELPQYEKNLEKFKKDPTPVDGPYTKNTQRFLMEDLVTCSSGFALGMATFMAAI